MLSWQNRKPQKSEYEKLAEKYREAFGKPWPEQIGYSESIDDTIAEIKECIENKHERKLHEYKKGLVY